MEEYWDSKVWKVWSEMLYEKTLTYQDKVKRKFYLDKYKKLKGTNIQPISTPVNKAVHRFEKGDDIYIVLDEYIEQLPFNVAESAEGYLTESDKTLLKIVTLPKSVRIKQVQGLPFKEFILLFNHLQHDNEQVRLFLNMLAFSMYWKPIKMAISGKRGAMKNANLHIYRQIFRDLVVVKTPSKANFQRMIHYYKKIIIDEVTSSTDKSFVRLIEGIVLSLGDGSPELEKDTLAKTKNMQTMDIDETSLLFTFNTLQEIKQGSDNNPFFDELWRNLPAVKDRIPCIKLPEGKVRTVFKTVSKREAKKRADKNFTKMKTWADTASYYSLNLEKELHGWKIKELYLTERHRASIEGLLDVMDAYSDTQAEFNGWMDFLNKAIVDYDEDVALLSDFRNDIKRVERTQTPVNNAQEKAFKEYTK